MNPPSAGLRSLAEQLVEHETGSQPDARQVVSGAEAVCRKLASGLEPLVGPTGFRVLLGRALQIARSEYRLLEDIDVGTAPHGWLYDFDQRVQGREVEEVRDAAATVLACSLRLLGHFIGTDLAVRIVSRAWPNITAGHASSAFETDAAEEGPGPPLEDGGPALHIVAPSTGNDDDDAGAGRSVRQPARTGSRAPRPAAAAHRSSALRDLPEPAEAPTRRTSRNAGTASP